MTGEFGGEREMCREERGKCAERREGNVRGRERETCGEERGKCAERREGNVRGRERETFPKYPELLENPITNY